MQKLRYQWCEKSEPWQTQPTYFSSLLFLCTNCWGSFRGSQFIFDQTKSTKASSNLQVLVLSCQREKEGRLAMNMEGTPALHGYYMPAEWEPHSQCWIGWPVSNPSLWFISRHVPDWVSTFFMFMGKNSVIQADGSLESCVFKYLFFLLLLSFMWSPANSIDMSSCYC